MILFWGHLGELVGGEPPGIWGLSTRWGSELTIQVLGVQYALVNVNCLFFRA
jgi:hypothetical protein